VKYLFCALLLVGCGKPKPVNTILPGEEAPEFWQAGPKPCVITIPPGRSLTLMGKVTIESSYYPDREAKYIPPIQVYSCSFGDKP
jgi:hypothetical protein